MLVVLLCIFIKTLSIKQLKTQFKIKNFDAKFTLGVVYRRPRTQTTEQFLEDFSKYLDSLNKDSKYYYILDDCNINLKIEKNIYLSMCCLNMLISYDAFPLITKPTRVTENSSSIIVVSISIKQIAIALGTRVSKFGISFLIQYVCYLQFPLR